MKILLKLTLTLVLSLSMYASHAFDPTAKPINVIIPFSPGGSVDAAFVHLQKYAAERKITLVPVFNPGAEGIIGTRNLVKSATDGYTIGITLAAVLGLYEYENKSLNLTVLTGLRNNIMVMVSNPAKFSHSLSTIDTIVKDNTSINFGYGSPSHKVIYEQYFKFADAKKGQTMVPYKGGAKVISDLIGGHVDIGILPLTLIKQQIDAKSLTLVAIAVNTDYAEYKDVPRLGKIYSGWKNFDGVIAVAPDNLNMDAKVFWDKFLHGYLNDKRVQREFLEDSTTAMKFGPQYIMGSIINNVNSLLETGKK